jgi:hypothetical protein
MLRDLGKALHQVWRLSTPDGGAYRPDLHYMRGPGPKWQAKYGTLYPKGKPMNGSAAPALQNLALQNLAQHRA